jgi:3-phenylpropionate/cinnamic acid dioxygenase small subunit
LTEDLAAHIAIQQVLYRYCAALDEIDLSTMLRCFSVDCVLSTIRGDYEGHDGIREFMRFVSERHDGLTRHLICNPIIQVVGESATCNSTWVVLEHRAERLVLRSCGVYDDRFVRAGDNAWAVRSRVIRHLYRDDPR